MSSNAFAARDVQRAECVGPAKAPVRAIYLHGLFPPRGDGGFYLDLEASNRDQLAEVAQQLKIRIAIPLAKKIHNGYRDWRAGKSVAETFANIERQAKAVCGSLKTPRAIIGFSEGGYFTRDIAFTCRTLTKSNYFVMIMSGAKPRAPDDELSGCTNLIVASGDADGSTDTCVSSDRCIKFRDMAMQMQSHYSNLEIETFPGGHILPPADLLRKYLDPHSWRF